ncbi:MAG: zinc ribbon domain-containing protein [Sphaerospermopsis kisseleviana]
MKTIKIKIFPTPEQVATFDNLLKESEWLWNKVLSNQLHNHCVTWYDWANKQQVVLEKLEEAFNKLKPEKQQLVKQFYLLNSDKPKLSDSDRKLVEKFSLWSRWNSFDLTGIIPTPVRIGNSAYEGISCQIAIGGNRWKLDDTKVIQIKVKGEVKNIKGTKLVNGDKPWTRIKIEHHSYKTFTSGKFAGRELTTAKSFDNMTGLNSIRAAESLPDLLISSDYVGGLLEFFEQSWKAFLDVKRVDSRKPKFKNADTPITTLSNNQKAPNRITQDRNTISVTNLGELQVVDKNWIARLNLASSVVRTYMITKSPSGYYINLVIAHPLQEDKAKLTKKLPKIKKEFGEESQEYLEAKQQLDDLESKILFAQRKNTRANNVTGIDPGVNSVIATDHGALFMPNIQRERVSIHIEKLQSQLNKIKDINDEKWKLAGNKGSRLKTKNEVRLQSEISRLHELGSNSSNAFNHKLSTRLSRTYKVVCWEDTKLNNLKKQAKPESLPEGVGYAHNGASAKRGLNWILTQRCLGDLKAKTKSKVEANGCDFKDSIPNYSSQKCHTCGVKGERLSQHEFVCKNPECSEFEKIQQADVNAAINHRQNAGFNVGIVKYGTVKLQYHKPKRFKKHLTKPAR